MDCDIEACVVKGTLALLHKDLVSRTSSENLTAYPRPRQAKSHRHQGGMSSYNIPLRQ